MAMLAVSVIFFAFGVNVGMWAAHIPVIQSRLGIDTGTLGLSLLSAAIGTMIAQPLAGMLVARVGSRPTTILFSVLAAISMAAAIASGSVVQLFIALAFIGIMWGAANVAMNTQGTELEMLRARPTLSSFHACASLGMLAGAWVIRRWGVGRALVLYAAGLLVLSVGAWVSASARAGLAFALLIPLLNGIPFGLMGAWFNEVFGRYRTMLSGAAYNLGRILAGFAPVLITSLGLNENGRYFLFSAGLGVGVLALGAIIGAGRFGRPH